MQRLERIFVRGVLGIFFLIASNILLFFFELELPITWLTLLFVFLLGWPGVLLLLIISLLA